MKGGGGGYSDIFIHKWARLIFWGVKNFESHYFFRGGVQKFFFFGGGGYEDFVDIFGRSSQNWTIFRGHFYVF